MKQQIKSSTLCTQAWCWISIRTIRLKLKFLAVIMYNFCSLSIEEEFITKVLQAILKSAGRHCSVFVCDQRMWESECKDHRQRVFRPCLHESLVLGHLHGRWLIQRPQAQSFWLRRWWRNKSGWPGRRFFCTHFQHRPYRQREGGKKKHSELKNGPFTQKKAIQMSA